MDKESCFDVLIIGGGPAGCSCALYTARSSLKTLIIDKNPDAGALAITSKIANYPGTPGRLSGEQLLQQMRNQAIEYGARYLQAQVYGADVSSENKIVYTPEGVFSGKTLVLATGAMGRTSFLDGEEQYLGRGVSYCATCDAAFFKGQDVAVYGENQESIDEALVLSKFASTVHWVAKRSPSKTLKGVSQLEKLENIRIWKRGKIKTIFGDDSGVAGIDIKLNSSELRIPVQGVFIYSSGSKPITDFLHGQVNLDSSGGVSVDAHMMTSVPGIWAIGDIRNTPYKQAVVACSDGCIAAMAIDKYLNQRDAVQVDWVHQ